MEKTDQLWPGGYRFIFDDALFQPCTDSFLLGAFPTLKRSDHVCDLGAGTGLLGLLLLAREPSLHITNVELQEAACALAQRNTALNALENSVVCLCADLRDFSVLPPAGSFDLVVSNPPYFPTGHGLRAGNSARETARADSTCSLDELFAAAARLLRWGGRFALCFRPERMAELMETARRHKLEPKRLRMVQNRADSAPSLLLLECRRGGGAGMQVEAPLLLTNRDGSPSAELDTIYFRDKR